MRKYQQKLKELFFRLALYSATFSIIHIISLAAYSGPD